MTIAELLVIETGRWMRTIREQPPEGTTLEQMREVALDEARLIVAAVYGPPCAKYMLSEWQEDSSAYNTKGYACHLCRWPRSMHKKANP